MQAQKAFDSPRRAIRGAVADLRDRLNHSWPKGRTALPPKRELILTPLKATYKGRREISHLQPRWKAVSFWGTTSVVPKTQQNKPGLYGLRKNSVLTQIFRAL
jgi:hypothetical protein